MEKEIVICLQTKEDELLTGQVSMLCERHGASARWILPADADSVMGSAGNIFMLISDDEALLEKARALGITVNTPQKMRESYEKAMEMLRKLSK
ncbi:hypothetical protein [Butyrivibrio sp. FCS014]|uniref:hypothetical protein n=1 Tax=Butyrivibrio sp. FCS014 TaxID=1408304 RepID=UPI0004636659|nr:hypothetical protein [Butyrivibrio sp. FCS014]